MEQPMHEPKTIAERLGAFTDGVIAVLITIMVLELKAPDEASFSVLLPLWPTAISYAVSYLFIAIIWLNHHHLLRFVGRVTPGLIWVNFAHLFAVSLVPFTTAWVARTQLASAPVTAYAAVFVCVNIAYLLFVRQVLHQATAAQVPARAKLMQRRRSVATLAIFASAMPVSLVAPRIGFGLICCALIFYVKPDSTGAGLRRFFKARFLRRPRPFH
jgi:Predicted integral membrane protein